MSNQLFSVFLRFPDGESSSSGSVDDTGIDGGTSIISRSDSVGSPGFCSVCAPIDSWSAEDIVDDAGTDGPGCVFPFIRSYPDSVNDPGPGDARSGLDSGDSSSGIEGSGCLRSVHPPAGTDGAELDDVSGWPKRSSHSSFNLSLESGDPWSGLDSGVGSSGIEGSGCLRSVHPSAGSDGAELDDSGFAEWSSGTPKSVGTNLSNSSPRFPNMVIASSGT